MNEEERITDHDRNMNILSPIDLFRGLNYHVSARLYDTLLRGLSQHLNVVEMVLLGFQNSKHIEIPIMERFVAYIFEAGFENKWLKLLKWYHFLHLWTMRKKFILSSNYKSYPESQHFHAQQAWMAIHPKNVNIGSEVCKTVEESLKRRTDDEVWSPFDNDGRTSFVGYSLDNSYRRQTSLSPGMVVFRPRH